MHDTTSAGVLTEVADATFDRQVRTGAGIEGGEPICTLVGAQPAQAVRDLLDPVLAQSAGAAAASPAPSVSWVPADACTLPIAEQPLRVAEFDTLFTGALRRLERREPGWLRLVLAGDPDVEASARELIARESTCCSFFDFQLTPAGGELQLDVRVPDTRVDVLDGITSQAHTAGSRS